MPASWAIRFPPGHGRRKAGFELDSPPGSALTDADNPTDALKINRDPIAAGDAVVS